MAKNTIATRGRMALNLKQYSKLNKVEKIYVLNEIEFPGKDQYILRMLIKQPFSDYKLPLEISWCRPMLLCAQSHNASMNIEQPYCYITIRNGRKQPKTNDTWHVDGFSMNYTHLPEQNYFWCNSRPTEYVEQRFTIPDRFIPYRHNIHLFFNDRVRARVKTMDMNTLYCIDPYIVHRRPFIPEGEWRTFVRITFCGIPIMDDNNTQNPLLPVSPYNRDGVKDFRNQLIKYNGH